MILIIFCFIGFPLSVILIGKINVSIQYKREVARLLSQSMDISDRTFNYDQISDLPEPVQRYFEYSLKNGQPYINSVYLKHDGQFKTALDKEWINIKGEQHFTAEEPGFLWKGTTSLFTVMDMYISGKGHIKVSLLNLFKVVDGEGLKYDQGELLRWLGESVWFPTNLLPGSRLQWKAVNDNEAMLILHYKDQVLNYRVSFNTKGEIIQLETQRYMGEDSLETWIGRVSDYEEINGMKIPMQIEAIWKLADGEHSYARFRVREIYHY